MELGDKEPKDYADQTFLYQDTTELNQRWALWTEQPERGDLQDFHRTNTRDQKATT